jgi:hypothetical protein
MDTNHPSPAPDSGTSRRDFLHQAATLATGLGALSPAVGQPSAPSGTLPTVNLGPHAVTRLIVGGNPIYGHSHFNKLLSQHQTAWHTPERVVELLKRCEQAGINTWQNSYAERTLDDLERFRAAGGKLHWLCLGKPDWDQHPEHIDDAARHKPIGSPHTAPWPRSCTGRTSSRCSRICSSGSATRACSWGCPPTTRPSFPWRRRRAGTSITTCAACTT